MSRAKKEIMRLRQQEIDAEKANIVNLAQNAIEKQVAEDAMNHDDDPKGYLDDVTQHGCQSGMVPGMVYYHDTVAFYDQHEELIWELLYAEHQAMGEGNILTYIAQLNGADNVGSGDQFKNLLAWWAYEHCAYQLQTRIESEG